MWLRAHLNLPTHPRLMVGFSLGRERAIRPGEVARVERGQRGVAATPSASCCERPSRPPQRGRYALVVLLIQGSPGCPQGKLSWRDK